MLDHELLETCGIASGATDGDLELGATSSQDASCFDQGVHPLSWDEPADADDERHLGLEAESLAHRCAARRIERSESLRVDPWWDLEHRRHGGSSDPSGLRLGIGAGGDRSGRRRERPAQDRSCDRQATRDGDLSTVEHLRCRAHRRRQHAERHHRIEEHQVGADSRHLLRDQSAGSRCWEEKDLPRDTSYRAPSSGEGGVEVRRLWVG